MATLYVVSTPIGHLGDLSARATDTLRSVFRVLAEDTRRSRVLLDHAHVSTPLVSLHRHNERERIRGALAWLDRGQDLALVSDAGTPLVSDPGARLVNAVLGAGHEVRPVPGPSAILCALVASGLPGNHFTFLGFPARKGPDRIMLLDRVAAAPETVVLFESPRRLAKLLGDLVDVCGGARPACVAREVTKVHEEFRRGTLAEVLHYYVEHPPRGEVTLVVGPVDPPDDESALREEEARELARSLLDGGARPSEAAREVARRLDLSRNAAYRIVQEMNLG